MSKFFIWVLSPQNNQHKVLQMIGTSVLAIRVHVYKITIHDAMANWKTALEFLNVLALYSILTEMKLVTIDVDFQCAFLPTEVMPNRTLAVQISHLLDDSCQLHFPNRPFVMQRATSLAAALRVTLTLLVQNFEKKFSRYCSWLA